MTQRVPNLGEAWLIGTSSQERENLKRAIINSLNSDPAIKRLIEIVESELRDTLCITRKDVYSSSDWSHVQAHTNGQREALTYVYKLLTGKTIPNDRL